MESENVLYSMVKTPIHTNGGEYIAVSFQRSCEAKFFAVFIKYAQLHFKCGNLAFVSCINLTNGSICGGIQQSGFHTVGGGGGFPVLKGKYTTFPFNLLFLFHYTGHGVPKPTVNGEIWVFNKVSTESIFTL
jgi:hypothetical protein